jgi:hypothetical protein
MSAIIQFVEPAEFLFQPEAKQNHVKRQPERPLSIAVSEAERPFWKPATPARSSAIAIVEASVLALFLVLSIAGIVSCFGELSHLLQSDAIGHVVIQAIGAGR